MNEPKKKELEAENDEESDEEINNEEINRENDEDAEEIEDLLSPGKPKAAAKPLEESKAGKKRGGLNYWAISSLVLAILLVISFFSGGFNFWGGELSKEEAAARSLTFINTNLLQGDAIATLESVEEEGDLYSLQLSLSGRPLNVFVTKDGGLLFPQAISLDDTSLTGQPETPTAVPDIVKSDQPVVELFVMSHCPYGTQAEKGILPVVEKLGKAIDFKVKFVYYAMHGKKELDEQMNQVCIQKEQNGKFREYLACFLDQGDGEACLTKAGIERGILASCVKALDKEYKITEQFNDKSTWLSGKYPLFDVDKAENEQYGVGGSPSLVVNGQLVSSGRTPAAYLATICAAFNDAPAECDAELSTASYPAGFGYNTAGTAGAAATGSCG